MALELVEAMGLEVGEMRLDGRMVPPPRRSTKPVKDSSAAVFGEVGVTKAAAAAGKEATGGGMAKAASCSDFLICDTDMPRNKAARSTEPAAKEEGKTKPAAKEEGKTKPAAKEEGKTKHKVVAVKTERVPDEYIQCLLKYPPRRLAPRPESFYEKFPRLRETLPFIDFVNTLVDVKEEMVRQYREKGYAIMGVDCYDNGGKRYFILPEESAAEESAA